MKKFIKGLSILVLGGTLLVGCQNDAGNQKNTNESTAVSSQAEAINVTIKVENDSEEMANQSIEVAEGTTLLEVLEDNFSVETTDEGFIIGIDGVSQDEANGSYWTFTINGDWGEKGAGATILSDGDEVVFSYGKI